MAMYDQAMNVYRRALHQTLPFRSRLESSETIEPLYIALMMLFHFQLTTGNQTGCLHYMRYVRAIFRVYRDWYYQSAAVPGSLLAVTKQGSPNGLEHDLIAHRLDLAAEDIMHVDEKLSALLQKSETGWQSTLPGSLITSFGSIHEAGAFLEGLLESTRMIQLELKRTAEHKIHDLLQAHLVVKRTLSFAQHQCLQFCLMRSISVSAEVSQRQEDTLRACRYWQAAFEQLSGSRSVQVPAVWFLQMRAFYCLFTLDTCRERKEERCDRFSKDFLHQLTLIERYLQSRQPSTSGKGPRKLVAPAKTNVFEWGVLRVLYM